MPDSRALAVIFVAVLAWKYLDLYELPRTNLDETYDYLVGKFNLFLVQMVYHIFPCIYFTVYLLPFVQPPPRRGTGSMVSNFFGQQVNQSFQKGPVVVHLSNMALCVCPRFDLYTACIDFLQQAMTQALHQYRRVPLAHILPHPHLTWALSTFVPLDHLPRHLGLPDI